MSDRVEKRLVDLLDHPSFSPYGNPIPGLAELGDAAPEVKFLDGVVSLPALVAQLPGALPAGAQLPGALPDAAPIVATVARLGEPLQTDVELLTRLASAGVKPGGVIHIESLERGAGISVTSEGADIVLDLPEEVSRHIFVAR